MIRALITIFGLGIIAVFMAAILTGRRKPPSPPISGAALLLLALLCGGCATTKPLDHNIIPAGWESACANGEREAVRWFIGKYGTQPNNPHYEWELLPDSRLPDVGAQCVSARRIQARASTHPSLYDNYGIHENKHRMNKANDKLDNEETVR